jgi:hypothetical protein
MKIATNMFDKTLIANSMAAYNLTHRQDHLVSLKKTRAKKVKESMVSIRAVHRINNKHAEEKAAAARAKATQQRKEVKPKPKASAGGYRGRQCSIESMLRGKTPRDTSGDSRKEAPKRSGKSRGDGILLE